MVFHVIILYLKSMLLQNLFLYYTYLLELVIHKLHVNYWCDVMWWKSDNWETIGSVSKVDLLVCKNITKCVRVVVCSDIIRK